MLGSLGFTEIAFILVLALLIFGPKRLPEIGRTLGRGLGEFRRATSDLKYSIESELSEPPARPGPAPSAATAPQARTAAAAPPAAGPESSSSESSSSAPAAEPLATESETPSASTDEPADTQTDPTD